MEVPALDRAAQQPAPHGDGEAAAVQAAGGGCRGSVTCTQFLRTRKKGEPARPVFSSARSVSIVVEVLIVADAAATRRCRTFGTELQLLARLHRERIQAVPPSGMGTCVMRRNCGSGDGAVEWQHVTGAVACAERLAERRCCRQARQRERGNDCEFCFDIFLLVTKRANARCSLAPLARS